MKRYFIHGDHTAEGKYFCAKCDLDVDQGHFYAKDRPCSEQGETDYARAKRMHDYVYSQEGLQRWTRPKEADRTTLFL
jgi:hypothetical protein